MKRAVTMGNFDGCHLGHQALFRTLKAVAEVNGLKPTVISFEPHSNYVLHTPGDPLLLTTTEEKREFIESLGLEFLVLPFTPEVAKLPFDVFVRQELIEKRGVCSMFFGHDHCSTIALAPAARATTKPLRQPSRNFRRPCFRLCSTKVNA